mgnify:CR=1 FL=1
MDASTHAPGAAGPSTLTESLVLVKGLQVEDAEDIDDDEEEIDEDGMIVAKTERASRAAHSPPPSAEATADALEESRAMRSVCDSEDAMRYGERSPSLCRSAMSD